MLELARPEDRVAVNALALQVHELHVGWRPDIYEMVEELYPEDRFRKAVEERQLYVARLGEIVVGYVLLPVRKLELPGHVKRKVMLVNEFCVRDEFRRQGIGQQMMMEVKALAKAFGCTDLQLSVYPENEGAVAFYQKAGLMIQNINMQMKL